MLPEGVQQHIVPPTGPVGDGWTYVGGAGPGGTHSVHPGTQVASVPVRPAGPIFPSGFPLPPEQEAVVDRFLAAWEEFGSQIKFFESPFEYRVFRATPTAPVDPHNPVHTAAGTFRYTEPNRIFYSVEGSEPERFISDGDSFFMFDFHAKKVIEFPLPSEMKREGTMLGPLPLVFGARASEMKGRYFVKLVTPEQSLGQQIWVQAWPRFAEEADDFQSIVIVLDRATFHPMAIRKFHAGGSGFTEYFFVSPSIRTTVPLGIVDWFRGINIFNRDEFRDWTRVVDRRFVDPPPPVVNHQMPMPPNTNNFQQPPPGRTPLYQPH